MMSFPDMKGLKILVTGGLGFIGSNLAKKCVELGARVTIYDDLDPNCGGNLYNLSDFKDKVDLHFQDLLNFDMLVKYVAGQDIIFNCAAFTSHPYSMREPWKNMDVNVRGTLNVLDAIRRFNPTVRLVHLGTSTQLGTLRYSPADEDHPEFPTDFYSANKSVSEKYVLIYSRVYGVSAVVIRLANIFGPRAAIHSPDFTFNNYFVGLALQGKDITVYGIGDQLRNILYVDDVVNALVLAAERTDVKGETFFAVSDEHFRVAEIARLTAEIIGRGTVQFVPWPSERKSIEVGDVVISNHKIKEMLGWTPYTDIRVGLVQTRDYYLNCLEMYIK